MFTFTVDQQKALSAIKQWYRQSKKQVFKMTGAAGTGKSTVISHLQEELNLSGMSYAVFTGKGALVLNNKGIPAITIHKLIYNCHIDRMTGEGVFALKEELDKDTSLIVIDEGSMVGTSLFDDLLSFGIKVLIVGDHNQLPPVKDTGRLVGSDVELREITRQAKDSPIIRLSQDVLNDTYIPFGKYAEGILVVPRSLLCMDYYANADQVLCGLNRTRHKLNQEIRTHLGFTEPNPMDGEKLICLKNDWHKVVQDCALMNGMIGTVSNIRDKFTYYLAEFQPEGLTEGFKVRMDKSIFAGQPVPPEMSKKINYFDYGYAITCHKAQGSEFDKIVIIADYFVHDSYKQWLYTAVTRAKQAIVLGL